MNLQPVWLAGLIGALSPYLTHIITGSHLSRKWKSLIALIVSGVIGFCSAWLSGQLSTINILSSIATAFAAAQLVYDQLFKDLL